MTPMKSVAPCPAQGMEAPLVQKKRAMLEGEGHSFSDVGKLTSERAAVMGVDDFDVCH